MNYKEVITNVPKNLLLQCFYPKLSIMNSEDTIKYILSSHVSISRFGDGEIELMHGYKNLFQDYSQKIANRLKEVKTTDKCLVCLPNIFSRDAFNKTIVKGDEYKVWIRHKLKYNYYYKKHFKDSSPLGDAFISRFYMRYNDKSKEKNAKYVSLLKKLWDNRKIVFIEGENSRLGYGNDLFDNAKSIERILCPKLNAFEKYDEIIDYITKNVDKSKLLILALGATATILSYDLSNMGYQALDLGHIDIEYEWFLMKATKKEPVSNKYVSECNSDGEVSNDSLLAEYKDQIIKRI